MESVRLGYDLECLYLSLLHTCYTVIDNVIKKEIQFYSTFRYASIKEKYRYLFSGSF